VAYAVVEVEVEIFFQEEAPLGTKMYRFAADGALDGR
jgi:hypothetical protein